MTKEERAKLYAQDRRYDGITTEEYESTKEHYIKGAIDQQKIGIEKVTSDSTIDELVKAFHNDSLAPCALREVLKGILIEAMED